MVKGVKVVEEKVFDALIESLSALEKKVERMERWPLLLKWVSKDQAAEMMQVSPRTVKRLTIEGELTYRKESRRIDIDLKSVLDYMEKYHIKGSNEL